MQFAVRPARRQISGTYNFVFIYGIYTVLFKILKNILDRALVEDIGARMSQRSQISGAGYQTRSGEGSGSGPRGEPNPELAGDPRDCRPAGFSIGGLSGDARRGSFGVLKAHLRRGNPDGLLLPRSGQRRFLALAPTASKLTLGIFKKFTPNMSYLTRCFKFTRSLF